jgi:NAD(P)H dehydrogenase (quinone)
MNRGDLREAHVPVDDVNVLVTFYSRGGQTERLAVLMAEGAVQAGARIRLRRARDVAPEDVIARDPAWQAARDRMHQEFAAPRVADAEWADVLCLGTPAGPGTLSPELGVYLEELRREVAPGDKIATAFTSTYQDGADPERALASLHAVLSSWGVTVMPAQESSTPQASEFERARQQGRRVVAVARAAKAGKAG